MIVPCIDLMDGKVVQLVQGREKVLEGDSPIEMLARFRAFPQIQVIDLDAAMNTGSNDALVELVHDDPLNAWEDIPVLELDGPLDGRLGAVLAALDQARRFRPRRTPLPGGYFQAVQEAVEDRAHRVAGGGAVVGAGDVEAGLGDHRDQQAGEGLDRHRRDTALLDGA